MLRRLRKELRSRCEAYRQAFTSKRLDLCSAQFAHSLHLAGDFSLQGKTCLELGAGRVLSHAIVCHLLGATKVYAVDLHPIARPEALKTALNYAVPSIVRDILSPFAEHSDLRCRLNRLILLPRFDLGALAELGIEYCSPVDIVRAPFGRPLDFVYSWSVLQHVPHADAPTLLRHLLADLQPGGCMLHNIHLEDIGHISDAPFAFLTRSPTLYSREQENTRGNRLRYSSWQSMFDALPGCNTRTLYAWQRLDRDMPPSIDDGIAFTDDQDLRTSHLGLWLQKDRATALMPPSAEKTKRLS